MPGGRAPPASSSLLALIISKRRGAPPAPVKTAGKTRRLPRSGAARHSATSGKNRRGRNQDRDDNGGPERTVAHNCLLERLAGQAGAAGRR